MRFFLAASVATTLLVGTGVTVSWAQKGKKGKDGPEMTTNMKQQFEWEEKVVGPREGLDHKKMAAIQERGKREDEERKKEPPKKVVRSVAEPSTASLPTMDIEKAAAPSKTKKAKVAEAPKQRDALDNLLEEQGVKPNKPPSGGDGLNSLLASSDDRSSGGSSGKAKKAKKKAH